MYNKTKLEGVTRTHSNNQGEDFALLFSHTHESRKLFCLLVTNFFTVYFRQKMSLIIIMYYVFQTEDESDVLDYSMASNTSSNSGTTPVKASAPQLTQPSPTKHSSPLSLSPGTVNTSSMHSVPNSITKSLLTTSTPGR